MRRRLCGSGNDHATWPNQRRQQFDGLGCISQEPGHGYIVCAAPGDVMRQLVASSMHDLHPISNAERPYRTTGVVEAALRGVDKAKFRMGEERRQNNSGKACASPHINDATVKIIEGCRKRRTHGPGKPDRVFDQCLDGRRTDDAGRTGRRPGLVKRDQLIVSQHLQRGR